MKYAQDSDKLLVIWGLWILSVAVITLTCNGLHRLRERAEKDCRRVVWKHCFCPVSAVVSVGIGVLWFDESCFAGGNVLRVILISVISGCLLFAAFMDGECQAVYNFVWIPSVLAVIGLLFVGWKDCTGACLWEAFLLPTLQELLFAQMYGRADCHCFSICALTQAALGVPGMFSLLHMLLAYAMLVIVQAIKGNIGTDGRLVRAVAFIPYITVSFFIILFFCQIHGR